MCGFACRSQMRMRPDGCGWVMDPRKVDTHVWMNARRTGLLLFAPGARLREREVRRDLMLGPGELLLQARLGMHTSWGQLDGFSPKDVGHVAAFGTRDGL